MTLVRQICPQPCGCFNFLYGMMPERTKAAPATKTAPRSLQLGSMLTKIKKTAREEKHPNHSIFRSNCPCCWRPLDLELLNTPFPVKESHSKIHPRYAFVVTVWGESLGYVAGAVALAQSIIGTGTRECHHFVCLHTGDVPEMPHRAILRRFWVLREVPYLSAVQRLYSCEKETSPFKDVFTKLHVMSLTYYTKVLCLDTDTLVLQNIDNLFDLPAPAAMRRGMNKKSQIKHGDQIDGRYFFADDNDRWDDQGRTSAWGQGTGINAGVMLLAPDWEIYKRMLYEISCSGHPAHTSGKGPEQDYYSRYFSDAPWTHIGVVYNFQLHQLYYCLCPSNAKEGERAVQIGTPRGIEQIRIVHFSGALKPWCRHLGTGPRDTLEDFVEKTLKTFKGWQLWVRKDREYWRNLDDGREEGMELGEDGLLYWSATEEHGKIYQRKRVTETPLLHSAASKFVTLSQKSWDKAWLTAAQSFPNDIIDAVDRFVHCPSCCSHFFLHRKRQDETKEWWCNQCWWQYEGTHGSRITLTASSASVQLWIDGDECPLPLPKLEPNNSWCVLLHVSDDKSIGRPTCIAGDDFTKITKLMGSLPYGRAVMIAVWGNSSTIKELLRLFRGAGGPDDVELNEGCSTFAMIGIVGLTPGRAVFSVGCDACVICRRIYARLNKSVVQSGRAVSCVVKHVQSQQLLCASVGHRTNRLCLQQGSLPDPVSVQRSRLGQTGGQRGPSYVHTSFGCRTIASGSFLVVRPS